MSGKKAKQLRRLARAETVGMPATGWYPERRSDGKAGRARVHPRTTRGVVKQLKRLPPDVIERLAAEHRQLEEAIARDAGPKVEVVPLGLDPATITEAPRG
jgi:hypothetical protein